MKKSILTLMVAALSLASCSPYKITTDYSEIANFSTYKTYQFRVDDLKLNDLDKDRVLNELSKQLQSKGLSSSASPDMIVSVKASHKTIKDINGVRPYGGFGWGGPWGFGVGMQRTWTSEYNQGSLEFDFIDARTNRLIWQGKGAGIDVDRTQAKQKQIPAMIAEIMKEYPPKR